MFAVSPRPDVDTFCIVYKGILEHHREENTKQGWSKDTALLYSTADWERIGGDPIEAAIIMVARHHEAAIIMVARHHNGGQIKYSFVLMLISPSSLARTSKFQKNVSFKMRAVGLINKRM